MAGVSAENCGPWQLDRAIKQEVLEEDDITLHSHISNEESFQKVPQIKTEVSIKAEKSEVSTTAPLIKQENSDALVYFPPKVYPCVQCSESFPKPIRLAAHVRLCHTRPFSCTQCKKSFYHKVSCDQHMKTHDQTEKPFKCNMCSRAFILKLHLDEHLRTHFGNKPFSCNTCGKSFRTYVLCKQHMKVHEEGYECVTCNVCFKKLRKPSSLAAHLERHSQRQEHTCTECGKIFSAARLLTAHRRTHAKPFACNVCDRRFTARHALNKHIANHSDPKMLFCVHCCKAFNLQRSLTVHLRTHMKEFPFLCTSCGKGFSEENELQIHRASSSCEHHHLCNTCGRSFKSPWGLSRHAVVHTEAYKQARSLPKKTAKSKTVQMPITKNRQTEKSSEKQLPANVRVCGHCYRVFTKCSAFTKHVLRHWKTSRSSCSSCYKRFSSSRILNQHSVSHAKEHKCPHCSVTFTRIPILTKHVRTHNFQKKRKTGLKCRRCGNLCKDYRSYVTHVRIMCCFAKCVNSRPTPKTSQAQSPKKVVLNSC